MSGRTNVRAPRVPSPLASGARVALVAPGSVAQRAAVASGVDVLRSWGLVPVLAPNAMRRLGDLAGGDSVRLADLVWALTADDIDAVWAVRGGWGAARLLDGLCRRIRRPRPRWVVGYSDLTALQLWLLRAGVASLYAPHLVELADGGRYVKRDLKAALFEPPGRRVLRAAARPVVRGRAEGVVVAGCLSVLASLAGTAHAPRLAGAILVLEDVGEAPYRIDRMLWQVRSSGMLNGVQGLCFGQFTSCAPAPGRSSRRLRDILAEHAHAVGVPSIRGLPVGHGRRVRPVPTGLPAELDATRGTLTITAP